MDIISIDDGENLYISPAIDEWQPLYDRGITAIFDLDRSIDEGIPTTPDHVLYVYFPITDADLPDLHKLHGIARLGASLIQGGHKVLSHCGMGYNRSALLAGLILTHMGFTGAQACTLVRERRPGALFNETFARYLESVSKKAEVNFSEDRLDSPTEKSHALKYLKKETDGQGI